MKLNRIAGVFIAVLLVAPTSLAAEDLTGKWSGSFTMPGDGGGRDIETAYLILKQSGKELTGTVGPNVDRQWPLLKGTVVVSGTAPKESIKVLFDVHVDEGTGPLLHFELELIDGHLKGNANAEQDGVTKTAVLDVTRVK